MADEEAVSPSELPLLSTLASSSSPSSSANADNGGDADDDDDRKDTGRMTQSQKEVHDYRNWAIRQSRLTASAVIVQQQPREFWTKRGLRRLAMEKAKDEKKKAATPAIELDPSVRIIASATLAATASATSSPSAAPLSSVSTVLDRAQAYHFERVQGGAGGLIKRLLGAAMIELDGYRGEATQYYNDNMAYKAELKTKDEELLTNKASLSRLVVDRERDRKDAVAREERLREARDGLKRQLETKEAEHEKDTAEYKNEIVTADNLHLSTIGELRTAENALKESRATLLATENSLDTVRREMTFAREGDKKTLDETRLKLELTERDRAEFQSTVKSLRVELATEIKSLQGQLKTEQTLVTQLREARVTRDTALARLRTDYHDRVNQVNELSGIIGTKDTELATAYKIIQETGEKLATISLEHDHNKSRFLGLAQKVADATKLLEAKEAELVKLRVDYPTSRKREREDGPCDCTEAKRYRALPPPSSSSSSSSSSLLLQPLIPLPHVCITCPMPSPSPLSTACGRCSANFCADCLKPNQFDDNVLACAGCIGDDAANFESLSG